MPSASNAAAERRIAPTLCGSVTWSSTTSGRSSSSPALLEQVAEPHVLQRIDLGHQPLVRRVAGHQPAEVGDVGKGDRDRPAGSVEPGQRLARPPELAHDALGIGERGE